MGNDWDEMDPERALATPEDNRVGKPSPGKASLSTEIGRPRFANSRRGAPGKVTHTQGLSHVASEPIQCAAGHDESPDRVRAAAARGLEGPARSLPFLGTIQESFGDEHDLSGVKAHIGGAGAEAANAMGASAYAVRDHVVFAEFPDLHTAAHEAAHVVQQRAGVQLYGGVGRVGDVYERHADAVADAVVAGRSARSLFAKSNVGSSHAAIQRKGNDDKKKQSATLPEGVNYRLLGTSGTHRVRTSWYLEGAEVSGDQIKNPAKMRELSKDLKKVFWWMTDEQVHASGDLYIQGPLPEPSFKVGNPTKTFSIFGLPPGTDIVWKSEGDGTISLILSLRVAGVKQPPSMKSQFKITHQLRQRIDDQFEKTFGLKPEYTMLTRAELTVKPKNWAWVFNYSKQKIIAHAGEGWKKVKAPKPADPTTEDTSPFGGQMFPNYIPIEDRKYYIKWMEEALGKSAPSGGTGQVEIDDDLIRQMKRLDQNTLLKEQVLDRMRRGDKAGGFAMDARSFRRLVHETQQDQEKIRMGLKPAKEPAQPRQDPGKPFTSPHDVKVAPKTRFFERPIYGRIVNLGSLASVNKKMDMYFQTEDRQGLGFVAVNVNWYASPMGEPTKHVRKGHTSHFAHHDPEKWTVSFDKVGKYEITAFVDHQSYWPTSFKTFVEVKTEDDRLSEVEQHAFGDFDDKTKVTDSSHFFDVSFTNNRFGPNKYTFGTVREGEVPDGWSPKTLDERLGFMARDKKSLEQLLARYKGRKDRASRDIVDYAEHALETMKSTEGRIREDARDLSPFEVRGAFLSEKNGVRSGDLNLVGLAGERHKKTTVHGQTFEWDQPTVRIHDMSKLYEPKNAVYTGEAKDFRASAEEAFIDLCKSYPPGRVSVIMEVISPSGKPTGKTLGFELHTGTAWKDAKEVVWDSKVQVVVNVVGAAVTIFVPGAAIVTMALITAYNAVDTIDNLASLQRKGQATWKDGVGAAVMIGLDLVPFLGEMKAVGKLGKTTLFALDAAQVSTTVVVLTDQGLAQVRAIRDEHVLEIARLQQEIEELRRVNDSNPQIAVKERELKEKIAEAQKVSSKVFADMAKNGAVMLMAPMAFNHMLRGFAKGTGTDLAKTDLFVEQKGVKPHYNPDTGKIHGDSSKLTPELMAKLQEAWTLDVYAQHADAANLLGVRTEEVVITRDASVSATTIKKNDKGVWEVSVPAKRKRADMLDDIWRERQKLPDAPGERPKALARGSYEPTFSADDIIAVGKPVVVGNRIENRGDADAIMQRLAKGDIKALKSLGISKLPKGFDPRSVEWGLGVLPDGKFIIVRGDHGAVNWGPFPEVRPLAHSHPLRQGKFLKSDGGPVGVHVSDMVKGGGNNELNKVNFFPSAADVAFCVRNRLATHTVHTPYVHKGKGMVGNPVRDFAKLPRVDIEIVGAQRIGSWEGLDHIPAYQAHVVVRDAKGTILWEGNMIAVHHPSVGSLIHFGPAPASWLKPGLGGGTSPGANLAPTRPPRNEVEELALADWQRLEKSGKNYSGKFDSDIWYDRYNEGLRYDLDKNLWYRPDGRKVRDPQQFDSKTWTKKKVYDHLAGDDSSSTFKKFAEMLIDEGIATRAKIENKIQEIGFLGRDEDMVRHELKVAYHDEIRAAMRKPKTEQGKFEAMRRITTRLDSADKGNLTEDWYKDVILGGKGDTHVAARKDTLEQDQGVLLEKNRFIDIVDGNIGREIKSGEGALGDSDMSQMLDYARMVDAQAKLPTSSGTAQIKHVRYSFTSPVGSKANVATMRKAFTDSNLKGRISFEVFNPQGKKIIIRTQAQLEAQAWLF